jgi:hypothetical protein
LPVRIRPPMRSRASSTRIDAPGNARRSVCPAERPARGGERGEE